MNTIKTLVVVATLLGVGYGAHVILNQPIPNGQFGEVGFTNASGFSKPTVNLDPNVPPSQGITLPPLAEPPANDSVAMQPSTGGLPPLRAQPTTPVQSLASQDTLSTQTPSPMRLPSTAPQTIQPVPNLPSQNRAEMDQGMLANIPEGTALSEPGMPTATPPGIPNSPLAGTSVSPVPMPNEGFAAPLASAPPPNTLAQPNKPLPPIDGSTVEQATATSPIVSPFDEQWQHAQNQLSQGKLVDALLTLSMTMSSVELTDAQRSQLLPLLDQLSGTVIYSREHNIETPYIVQAGDSLESIAQSYGVPAEFVMRTNGLASPSVQPGQRLKVVRGPFRGQLDLNRRELTLFANKYYAGRFQVAIGRDFPQNATALDVIGSSGIRPYQDLATGTVIPAGDPQNPYGRVWIGMRANTMPDLSNVGLHDSGTGISAADARGCLTASAEDADDLRAILAVGSRIHIVR